MVWSMVGPRVWEGALHLGQRIIRAPASVTAVYLLLHFVIMNCHQQYKVDVEIARTNPWACFDPWIQSLRVTLIWLLPAWYDGRKLNENCSASKSGWAFSATKNIHIPATLHFCTNSFLFLTKPQYTVIKYSFQYYRAGFLLFDWFVQPSSTTIGGLWTDILTGFFQNVLRQFIRMLQQGWI